MEQLLNAQNQKIFVFEWKYFWWKIKTINHHIPIEIGQKDTLQRLE